MGRMRCILEPSAFNDSDDQPGQVFQVDGAVMDPHLGDALLTKSGSDGGDELGVAVDGHAPTVRGDEIAQFDGEADG